MPLYFGQDKAGSLYLGSTKIGAAYMGNVKVYDSLPPGMTDNTIKFKFSDGSYDPSSLTTLTGATWTQESSSPNIWVWDGSNVVDTDWSASFNALWTAYGTNDVEIIDAGALTIPTAVGYSVGSTSRGMFKGNTALVGVSCPLYFKNARDCSRIFSNCKNLTGLVAIKCPSATTLTDCFGGSNSTSTKVTAINVESSSSLTKTNQMCRGCPQLTSFSISNMSRVTDTSSMFRGCTSLQSLSLPSLNSLTTVSSMFGSCTSLTSVVMPDTESLTSTLQLFSGCTRLTSVTMSDTSAVTDMFSMFSRCTSLTTAPQLDTSAATDMSSMFQYCTSLTDISLLNTSAATDMSSMFQYCTSLTDIPQLNTSNVRDVYSMFNGCTNVASGALALYNQMSTQTNPPTMKSHCFYNCGSGTVSGLADLEQIPYSWGGKVLDESVVSLNWVLSPSTGQRYGWYSTDDNMKFQLWREVPQYSDIVTLNSMTVYTSTSLSQYAGISMRRSAIAESYGTFNAALGNALNFYLAIYQVDNSYLNFAAISPLYGSLGANEDEIDMPGTVASMTISDGVSNRCDHTLGWRLGFIVFNDLPNSSNFGILYNYYFNTNPGLYCTSVNPASAFRY